MRVENIGNILLTVNTECIWHIKMKTHKTKSGRLLCREIFMTMTGLSEIICDQIQNMIEYYIFFFFTTCGYNILSVFNEKQRVQIKQPKLVSRH